MFSPFFILMICGKMLFNFIIKCVLCVLFFFLGKIEVKILTRKNIEEAGDQWLTEEDTKSFRELLINLLVTEVTETFHRVYLKVWSFTFCTVGLCLSVCVYLIVLIYCKKNSVWSSFSTDWRHRRGLQRAKKAAGVGEQLQVRVGRVPGGVPGFQHFRFRWCGRLSSSAAVSAHSETVSSCGDLQPHIGKGTTWFRNCY